MTDLKMEYNFAELPLTKLHYVKCGQGEPLIIVPATISELDNWKSLIRCFGQYFTVYFFELPGHGKSTPFKTKYTSELVAETVEDFVDHLGYDRIHLMGFSFGGILALKSLDRLRDRVEKVILFAPCVTHRAIPYPRTKMKFVKLLIKVMKKDRSQKILLGLMHSEMTVDLVIWLLRAIGKIEKLEGTKEKLLELQPSTLDVLVYQIDEVITVEPTYEAFNHQLYFGMSTKDPLLDFEITEEELRKLFKNIQTKRFDFAYHQPPKPFTFEELNSKFNHLLQTVKLKEVVG